MSRMSTKIRVARRAFSLKIMGGPWWILRSATCSMGSGPRWGGDEHPAQGRQILPVVLEVTQVHRVALQALHRVVRFSPPGR